MKKQKEILSNADLLHYYNLGWSECYDGAVRKCKNKMLQRAYDLGWAHYIMGDDVSSVDYYSKEQILKSIKS